MALAMLSACGPESAQPPAAPPLVTVARPLADRITDWDEYTGRIEPVESVEVRARVSGYLQSVHFDEGSEVEEGDLLFVIDARPYLAVAEAAVAEVTRARVRLDLADNELDRAERLFTSRATSEEARRHSAARGRHQRGDTTPKDDFSQRKTSSCKARPTGVRYQLRLGFETCDQLGSMYSQLLRGPRAQRPSCPCENRSEVARTT
jgi:hypothetical protein